MVRGGVAVRHEWDRSEVVDDLDEALVAARAGGEDGFVALYRGLQPRMLRYVTALVGADAEDATAEAWLQIARDIRTFTGDLDGFRGWVTAICRNRAMDLARARSRRRVLPTDLGFLAERAGSGDTASTALDTLSTRAAVELIAGLPRDQAEAVLLRAVVGLDAAAAGQVLGKRPGAVRVAAHRGLRRLARELTARVGERVRPQPAALALRDPR
jgi:RNA polymerase sigma-70 factor (ECF subfamily)